MLVRGTVQWVIDSVVPNTTFNHDNKLYVLQLQDISEEDSKALVAKYGIWTRDDKPDCGLYIKAKSKFPFRYEDGSGNQVIPETIENGTPVVVDVTGSYSHKFDAKYGKGPSLSSLVKIL